MKDVDIADTRRRMGAGPAGAIGPDAQQQTADQAIKISNLTQQCQQTIPLQTLAVDVVTVTVTSQRPGVAAQVSFWANFNSLGLSYQGPSIAVGQDQFTDTKSRAEASFAVQSSSFPILGVAAAATWADGAPESVALQYAVIVCFWKRWWIWLMRLLGSLGLRPSSASATSTPPQSGSS
jgi:hypothetical protein